MTKEQKLLDIIVDIQQRTINLKEGSEQILSLFETDGSEQFIEPTRLERKEGRIWRQGTGIQTEKRCYCENHQCCKVCAKIKGIDWDDEWFKWFN